MTSIACSRLLSVTKIISSGKCQMGIGLTLDWCSPRRLAARACCWLLLLYKFAAGRNW